MAHFVSIALTNAADGADDAYNDWYTNRHMLDVLAIPGVKSVRRYRLSELSRSTLPYRYMALYELETDDLPGIFDQIRERAGTALMPRSPAMSADRLFLDFEPVSEFVTAEDAARLRDAGATE